MKLQKKEFESIFKKTKHEDKKFSSHKQDWKNFEQNNQLLLISYFYRKIVKK